MDGMLSQDEINALLSGMSLDDGPSSPDSAGDAPGNDAAPASGFASGGSDIDQSLLTDVEKDAIGEVANISMGTSATTLFNLVNQKVDITTPVVSLANWETVTVDYPNPCVFIQIKYTVGLNGSNILVLQENDVKIITDLMMGGDGSNTSGELGELHLSAISEAMNQMMGSSATSLSTMLGKKIDISPPNASLVNITESREAGDIDYYMEGTFVKVAFHMTIGDLVDSNIIQLYPLDFAKSLYDVFMNNQTASAPAPAPAAPAPSPAPAPAPAPMPAAAPMPAPAPGAMPYMMPPAGYMPPAPDPVNVQPASFQAFSKEMAAMIGQENISLIMDVPLGVTVELGRTSKTIKEILEFAPGTIIELDKIAGEPIDVLVNGKFVAKGEVVVIEESFGIRVTEIIKD